MKNFPFCNLLLSIGLFFLLTACEKDEFTKPAQVNLQMELVSEEVDVGARMDAGARQSKNANIRIESIQYNFSGMEFEGYRENGENYFFSREFEGGKMVEVKAGSSSPILTFDMPQGVYERIKISLQVNKSKDSGREPYNETAALLMRGHYTNPQDREIPLIFVYDFDEVFGHTATPASGTKDIAVKQSQVNTASFSFDVSYWLQLINGRMLQSAILTEVDAQPSIIISAEKNEHIFNLLTSRIKNAKQLTFR